MKKYKSIEVHEDTFCDICGNSCKDKLGNYESASLSADWGYSSGKDGTRYDIDLCEKCFDETIEFLKSKTSPSLPLDPLPLKGHDAHNGF